MFSGSILVLTVLAVSFIGDGLRDAFDPGSLRVKKSVKS
jgi:ABC-type dipeptide/oligopeptide/nickel transport system permease subunit